MKNKPYWLNENFVSGLEILEALEGTNFEPVPIARVVERVNIGKDKKLTYDQVRRLLLSAQVKGWTKQNDQDEWTLGSKILRLSRF